jgi:hypothetical protein
VGSLRFNKNEEFMEGVKTWLSSQTADFFDRGNKNAFPDTTSASIPAVRIAHRRLLSE